MMFGNKNTLHSHQVFFIGVLKRFKKFHGSFLQNWLADFFSSKIPGRLGSFSFLTLLLAMGPPEIDFVDVNLGQLSVLRTIIALIKISNLSGRKILSHWKVTPVFRNKKQHPTKTAEKMVVFQIFFLICGKIVSPIWGRFPF